MDWLCLIEQNKLNEFRDGLEKGVWEDRKGYLLVTAAEYGRPEMVQMLLKHGADPNKKHGDRQFTPLHRAMSPVPIGAGREYCLASPEHRLRVLALLLEAGADVNARETGGDAIGWTPLHCLAGGLGSPQLAQLLYDYGADLDATDAYGHTPIFFARDRHYADLVNTLTNLARIRPPRRCVRTPSGNAECSTPGEAQSGMPPDAAPIPSTEGDYSSSLYRFSLAIPSGWRVVTENAAVGSGRMSPPEGQTPWITAVSILGPRHDSGAAAFQVCVLGQPAMGRAWTAGAQRVVPTTIHDLLPILKSQISGGFHECVHEGYAPTTVSGLEAHQFVYRHRGLLGVSDRLDHEITEVSVFVFAADSTYQMICECPTDHFAENKPKFVRLLRSFRLRTENLPLPRARQPVQPTDPTPAQTAHNPQLFIAHDYILALVVLMSWLFVWVSPLGVWWKIGLSLGIAFPIAHLWKWLDKRRPKEGQPESPQRKVRQSGGVSPQGPPPQSGSDRSAWSLQQYAQAIADRVTNTTPCENSGLETHSAYVRQLGQEISDKFGFEGMQHVWQTIHSGMGPSPCSDLTRLWDGIGRWQK